jgi:hypothetical protein
MTLIVTGFVLLAIAWLGAGLHDLLGKSLQQKMPLVLAFGGAFLIGLIFTHLVPEAYALGPQVGLWVLVGFLIQIALEYMSQGIEHGHAHPPKLKTHIPWTVFISLCLHAFLESMPLAEGEGHHDHAHHHHVHLHMETLNWPLLLGLAVHKLPVAVVLMSLLRDLEMTQWGRWALMTLFGLMPVAGMWVYDWMVHMDGMGQTNTFPMMAQGILIGILMHISTTILFETSDGHRFNAQKLTVTILALLMSISVSML